MDGTLIGQILIAVIGIVAISKTLYETDNKKREFFIQILVLIVIGVIILFTINELDKAFENKSQTLNGVITFTVITGFCFLYGLRKNGKSD